MVGDHIRARKGGRWSHGIDCGDETIIHLLEDPSLPPGDRVRRSYRPEFVAGAEAVEVVTHRERVFSPRQVVARAFSRTGDAALAAMFRDSQQFAEWCKTGRIPETPRNVAISVPGVPTASAGAAPTAKPAGRANGAAAKARPAVAKSRAKVKPAPMLAKAKAARKVAKAKAAKPKPARKPARQARAKAGAARKTAAKAKPARASKGKAKAGKRARR
jgi:hypothetical protein